VSGAVAPIAVAEIVLLVIATLGTSPAFSCPATRELRMSAAAKPCRVPGHRELECERSEAEQHPERGALSLDGVRVSSLSDRADDERCHRGEHDDPH
jgi:hypothetical protein